MEVVQHGPGFFAEIRGVGLADVAESDAAYSYVALETGLDLTALADHYAAQLERAGWSRTSEGQDGPQAWIAWTFTDGKSDSWTGTFTALRLPATPARYLLQINAVRTPNH